MMPPALNSTSGGMYPSKPVADAMGKMGQNMSKIKLPVMKQFNSALGMLGSFGLITSLDKLITVFTQFKPVAEVFDAFGKVFSLIDAAAMEAFQPAFQAFIKWLTEPTTVEFLTEIGRLLGNFLIIGMTKFLAIMTFLKSSGILDFVTKAVSRFSDAIEYVWGIASDAKVTMIEFYNALRKIIEAITFGLVKLPELSTYTPTPQAQTSTGQTVNPHFLEERGARTININVKGSMITSDNSIRELKKRMERIL